jgi:cysteine-S-conjugate beta-lyase
MNKYDFDTVYDRHSTGCFKTDGLAMLYGNANLLPLWVADMDFAVAPEISQALEERLKHPIFGYNLRLTSYYYAIIHWLEKHYNWRIERNWIINTPGIVTAINVAVVTLTIPGDKVLLQTPVYDPFFEAVRANGRNLLTNPLQLIKGRYEIDFDDLEKKLAMSKLFILCNPHNPVGRVWTVEELLKIGCLCRKYKVKVVADEIHADIIYSGHRHTAFCTLEDFSTFTIACYSPSKSFNLAGLCTSAIIIPQAELREMFNNYVQTMHLFLGNTFGITALQAAYTLGDDWLSELLAYLEKNREFLCNFVTEKLPAISIIKPEGTYLAWLDFRALGLADETIMQKLINEAGLALSPGKMYGDDGSGFIRLNFACPQTVLKQACERLYSTFGEGSL